MDFGSYIFNDIEFNFIFDGNKLTLIPKDEINKEKAKDLTYKSLGNGVYAYPGDPIRAEQVIEVYPQNHSQILVLYPISDFYYVEDRQNNVLSLEIGSWFHTDKNNLISGLSIHSDVLDRSYDIQGAVDKSSLDSNGNIEISSSRKKGQSLKFKFDDIEIERYISYFRKVSCKAGELPIRINSQLSLSFNETNDYMFVRRLVDIVHCFLAFIAQGYDYRFDDVELLRRSCYGETTYTSVCGKYIETNRGRGELTPEKVLNIAGHPQLPELIFKSLTINDLVLEHLPSIKNRNSYNMARLIMNLVAIDKTLESIYKDGIEHSRAAIESREAITNVLDNLIMKTNSSRVKSDTNWLIKIINNSDSLETRLSQLGKDHRELFNKLEGVVFVNTQKCTAFFHRVSFIRNKMAHGDFSVFNDCSYDDIEGIDKLLLAAQLVMIGMNDDNEIATIVKEVC